LQCCQVYDAVNAMTGKDSPHVIGRRYITVYERNLCLFLRGQQLIEPLAIVSDIKTDHFLTPPHQMVKGPGPDTAKPTCDKITHDVASAALSINGLSTARRRPRVALPARW